MRGVIVPRTPPRDTIEHRLTLGSFERERLDRLVERTERDRTIEQVLDVSKAVVQPVGLVIAAYIAYYGMIGWATNVDSLKERFTEAPAGVTLGNIRRLNPVYRFLTWAVGGENPPLVTEEQANTVADALASVIPDVSQGNEGEGGGGGSRSGIFGGSVFM